MRSADFLLLSVWGCATAALGYDDLILRPPLSKRSGPVGVLYFAQGANLETSQYVDLLQIVQEKVNFPLWVGIPQCAFNSCAVPGTLTKGIARITSKLEAEGMKATLRFYGGHSLGGAMTPPYVSESDPLSAGMVLMGSFLTHAWKTDAVPPSTAPQVSFPVATLTIGGELDGLCRLSRMAEASYSQIDLAPDPASAALLLPVTVIEGLNHMNFASGEPPAFVKEHDLVAEISPETAHALIARDTALFLDSRAFPDEASYSSALGERVRESRVFVSPLVDSLLMEAFAAFLPPCYCETEDEYGYLQYGTCETTPACYGGVPWTAEFAQKIMAGVSKEKEVAGLSLSVRDSMHLVTEEKPSCHLPHIHGNAQNNANPGSVQDNIPPLCAAPQGCSLDVTTVTQHAYVGGTEVDVWRLHFNLDWLDTGYLPVASRELKTKLKSREAVWNAAGLQSNVNFTSIDQLGNRCMEINAAAIQWALDNVSPKTRERFVKYGQQLTVGEDLSTCAAGPCWIWDPLRFNRDDEQNIVTIQSVFMATENYNKYPCGEDKLVPCSAGFHYCKLLSPARAVEWMHVDGLKNKLSLKDE